MAQSRLPATWPRQSSFGGGEFSPSLYGADHLREYREAARTLRNLYPSKVRTALNRPGTIFCHEVKDSTKATRLASFIFSNDQAFVLELGDKNIRVTGADGAAIPSESLVALGTSSARQRSGNVGVTWVDPGALPATDYRAVCKVGSRYVAVGLGASCAVSDDGGLTWTAKTIGNGSGSGSYYGLAYNGHTLVAVGHDNTFAYSLDQGDTWTAGVYGQSAGKHFEAVAWGSGRFIAVGYLTATKQQSIWAWSYDGVTWTHGYGMGNATATWAANHAHSVCFLNGEFIAVGGAGANAETERAIWWRLGATDANWTWGVMAPSLPGPFYSIASDSKAFAVTVGASGIAFVYLSGYASPWQTTATPGGSSTYTAVTFSRGYFIAVGTNLCARATVSPGGSPTWDTQTIGNGAYLCIAGAKGDDPLEVTTPYPLADVPLLKTAQSGDILTFFHRKFVPAEFRRYGNHDWRLEAWYKNPPTQTVQGLAFVGTPDQTGDSTHPPKAWQWAVTWEDEETGVESLACPVLTPSGSGKVVLYPDKPLSVSWTVLEKARRYHVYRGRNGELGYIGTTPQPAVAQDSSPTTVTFNDDGQLPIMSDSPPRYVNPFQSDLTYPAAGCYFDDRLVVGGSLIQPATLKLSGVSAYYDFDEPIIADAADSLEFTLSTRRFEEIRWLVPLERLIVGTSESEWVVGGAGVDEPISAESVLARARSNRGSSTLQPVVVGAGVVYVQNGGKVVRDFAYQADLAQWGGAELSLLSQHLLEGYSVVDIAYAKEPHSTVWIVRSDGALLSITFIREDKLWAWARHDTDGDAFEAVTVVPNGTEDVPFFVVRRTIAGQTKRYVERMATRYPAGTADGVFVDSALVQTYPGGATQAEGFLHLSGRGVWAVVDGVFIAGVVTNEGIVSFQGVTGTNVVIGLPIVADFESLDFPQGRAFEKLVANAALEFRASPAPTDPNAGVYLGQDLSHVEGLRKLVDAENGVLLVPIDASYNPGGRVALRHNQPFPLEIRGIAREVRNG